MKISQFTVFGERCSGTNHAAAWIKENTGLEYRMDFGWKHGGIPVTDLQKSAGVLCVLVARNLPDWLRSLHLKPHHMSPKMRGLTFYEFIQRRVDSVLDHTMGVSPRDPAFGQSIMSEQHNGKPFANVIRMRRHKHRCWLKDMEKLPHAVLLRHEDLVNNPMRELRRIERICQLSARQDVVPVARYKGQDTAGVYQPKKYAGIDGLAMRHILEQVDLETEIRLGYDTPADLLASALPEDAVDVGALRQALIDKPEHIATLDALLARMASQSDQLDHAKALSQGQRKYLISLFDAINRARPARRIWPWQSKP